MPLTPDLPPSLSFRYRYSDGDLPGETAPQTLADLETGNAVMQALGYLLFITSINTAVSLFLMDSPGMLPVWMGRAANLLPVYLKKTPTPQHELDTKWRAPESPIHIWTSKLAGALVAVCAIGPWYPLIYFGAALQVVSMLFCELWALLKLHSKPTARGFEVAKISASIYQGCIGVAFISTLYVALAAHRSMLHTLHTVRACSLRHTPLPPPPRGCCARRADQVLQLPRVRWRPGRRRHTVLGADPAHHYGVDRRCSAHPASAARDSKPHHVAARKPRGRAEAARGGKGGSARFAAREGRRAAARQTVRAETPPQLRSPRRASRL